MAYLEPQEEGAVGGLVDEIEAYLFLDISEWEGKVSLEFFFYILQLMPVRDLKGGGGPNHRKAFNLLVLILILEGEGRRYSGIHSVSPGNGVYMLRSLWI